MLPKTTFQCILLFLLNIYQSSFHLCHPRGFHWPELFQQLDEQPGLSLLLKDKKKVLVSIICVYEEVRILFNGDNVNAVKQDFFCKKKMVINTLPCMRMQC